MMKTLSLGKLFGVEVKLHGTFLLLLAFVALSGLMQGGLVEAILSLALSVLIFGVVVAHEFGHILAARRYGLKTKDVILSPIGGMARLEGMPMKPTAEAVIAAAGPAVNLVLAGLGFLFLNLFASLRSPAGLFTLGLTDWFITINLVLLGFNLIPAIPMDGGRILRALLSKRLGYLRATQVAARVARWSALAMAAYAIYAGQFTLLLIAGFVFVMSWMEVAQATMRQAQQNPIFQVFGSRSGGGFGAPGGPTAPMSRSQVVDQNGQPVGDSGWKVSSVRWSDR